ncbi:unnamed protein product [Adineta ricciae]|uniref:Uncharacterized protein n=1 Tax=Adineta ricciae TaxID=249248 RepID=A0A815UTZ3_ADIRI|nr:unnamed protein product [Adineta ricciae]CAF1523603.1 unnamed protein product [Adineta ricciae]
MVFNIKDRLWQTFLRLDLFKKPSSTEQTLQKELIATRFYVCSLIISLIILTIITAFTVRTIESTESRPSYKQFIQLAEQYPNTLNCPCSKYAINYQTFITTQVKFHQVCSSQFIEQKWFEMLFTNQNISMQSTDDFRITLTFFWQIIGGLCNSSRKSWENAIANFQSSHILSPTATLEETLRIQSQTEFQNQIQLSQTTLARNLLAIRRMTSGNEIVSGLQTNFYLKMLSRNDIQASPRVFNNCSCTNIKGCPRPATFSDEYDHFVTIPGMIMDCLMVDATLASTLECYYNETCISLLHSSSPIHIRPLSNATLTRFPWNATIQTLLNELMIEEMKNDIRFDLYYSQCAPQYCSYSYTRRFYLIFIITMIIGVVRGLSFGLRFLALIVAKVILHRKNRIVPHANVSQIDTSHQNLGRIWSSTRQMSKYSREKLASLNVFEDFVPRTPRRISRERVLTKLFMIVLLLSSFGIALYVILTEYPHLTTLQNPSLTLYEQLYEDYSDTLQCPCSHISVPYKSFMNVSFILHQVCSSDLVSSDWLSYLAVFDPATAISQSSLIDGTRDFRTMGVSYFQFLSTFCSMVQTNIDDAQRVFRNTPFVNDRVLSRSVFNTKTQPIIDSFIDTTRNNFIRTIDWVKIGFTAGRFFNGANVIYEMKINVNNQLDIAFASYPQYSEFTAT